MAVHDSLRESLELKLEELTQRARKIEGDLRRRPHVDSGERAIELENDPVLEELDVSTLQELNAIQAALGRIEAGTYGICTHCGEPISDRRLEVLSYTATCIGCAA